jgi:hypothetical protein
MTEEMFSLWEKINPDVRTAYKKLIGEPRTKRGHFLPIGYKNVEGAWIPIPELVSILVEELYFVRYRKSHTLRSAISKVKITFDLMGVKPPSVQGMSKVLDRLHKDLGLATATQKEFISERQRMALEVKAATGSIPHTKDLREAYAKVKYKEQKDELKEIQDKERRLKNQMTGQAKRAKISGKTLTEDVKKTKVKSTENPCADAYLAAMTSGVVEKDIVMPLYLKAMEEALGAQRKVAFLPTPKQYDFMSADEDIVLYGGAAGGGKSYALLFDAIRYAHMNGYRGVLIRRTMPELRELIDFSRELYPKIFKGAKYNSSEKTWRFPSGAILEFGFLDNPSDKYQYQGKQYAWVGFDELGLQDTPEGFDYLKSRLRTTLPIKPAIRCTANPGSLWVKERFIDPAPANTTFRDKAGLTYRFIPSLISDNPYIYQNGEGQYVKMLTSMSEVERRQLLEGDWTVSDDSAFPEFELKTHVVSEALHYPPAHWSRFCGIDYGYSDQSAAVWGAINPDSGQVVIYREFAQSGLEGYPLAQKIIELEQQDLVPIDHVVDHTIWNKSGHTGPTIGQAMQAGGLRMRMADKNRSGGKIQIHSMLRIADGEPGMVILDSCPRTIRELQSLRKVEKRPGSDVEDIKQTRLNGNHNDLYDALRYALMSRPRRQTLQDALSIDKGKEHWGRINKMFN